MNDFSDLELQRMQGRLGRVAYEMARVHFAQMPGGEAWQPAINAYRCSNEIRICVDLAGVDKKAIDLTVEPNRLRLRGRRPIPEPADDGGKISQVLALEIDHGPFEREIELPAGVDTERITAEQRNGLLWIQLPLRPDS